MEARRSEIITVLLAVSLLASAASADCTDVKYKVKAGVRDNFALPTEPTQQSPEYSHFLKTYWVGQGDRVFDETGIDLALGYSFTGWRGYVCGATLEFHVKAYASLSDNDSFRLGYTGSTVPANAFVYWCTFRFVSGTGSWYPGAEATFEVDLADLPPYSHFPTNILAELQDGELEFMVEDDTLVDYAILRVCRCHIAIEPESWGRVKARYE